MAIETKVINTSMYGVFTQQEIIDHYTCFGWQTISVTDTRVTMNRNNNLNNYMELVTLGKEYEDRSNRANLAWKASIINVKLLIILLLLFIVGGVFYILNKMKWRKIYRRESNAMLDAVEKARTLYYAYN
ncbi:hypothetical protein [Mycoplasmopsis fermentans]|uniref:Uncharacterized protein n=2 Tax=Mycoplasmopsis fermentans TaxID=2115 RepID=C4XEK5_MYCFP|nr:hypothetical protein [Mycoplasmopsis fermentans]ADV34279.1 Hypothetical Protein MfeM64YM_0274 [Mycoplasmopsis fermentans M64]BAH69577.1 hypothetical protein MBIO_0312 [Mycoplasmopsis fermentans PG18]VEU60304.1 Uncharacterised protein [Mycoplasmopsis fermentans]VEU67445.1 Uncharacterised protein [Mesomycoplasma conjunctivae]